MILTGDYLGRLMRLDEDTMRPVKLPSINPRSLDTQIDQTRRDLAELLFNRDTRLEQTGHRLPDTLLFGLTVQTISPDTAGLAPKPLNSR